MKSSSIFRAVLALVVAANVFGLVNVALNRQRLLQMFSGLQPWMLVALATLSVASIAACLALWRWKRWGFLLIGSAYTLMLGINLSFHAPLAHTALAPLGLAILLAAAWPVRRRFSGREPARDR